MQNKYACCLHQESEEYSDTLLRELWSSGSKHTFASSCPRSERAQAIRQQGNIAFKDRRHAEAAELYSQALQLADAQDLEEKAVLLSNRSRAHFELALLPQVPNPAKPCRLCVGSYADHSEANASALAAEQAVADAQSAAELQPDWPKPFYLIAQAHLQGQDYMPALQACRKGQRKVDAKAEIHDDFASLLDQITFVAALQGEFQVFDGRHLEVCCAFRPAC